MEASLISCIVPVFNGKCYLREALESILAQTYRPLEIIVADDGSTDETAALLASRSTASSSEVLPHRLRQSPPLSVTIAAPMARSLCEPTSQV